MLCIIDSSKSNPNSGTTAHGDTPSAAAGVCTSGLTAGCGLRLGHGDEQRQLNCRPRRLDKVSTHARPAFRGTTTFRAASRALGDARRALLAHRDVTARLKHDHLGPVHADAAELLIISGHLELLLRPPGAQELKLHAPLLLLGRLLPSCRLLPSSSRALSSRVLASFASAIFFSADLRRTPAAPLPPSPSLHA